MQAQLGLSQLPRRKFGPPSLIPCCEVEQELAITGLQGGHLQGFKVESPQKSKP